MPTLRTAPEEQRWRDPLIAAYLEVWDAPHWNTVDRDEAETKADHAFHPESTLILATTEGTVTGFAWARPLHDREAPLPEDTGFRQLIDPGAAYLESMGVVPAHRGRGLGTRILEALLSRLDAMYPQVVLRTTHEADAAVHLYEEHGFEDTGVADPEEPERTFFVKHPAGDRPAV